MIKINKKKPPQMIVNVVAITLALTTITQVQKVRELEVELNKQDTQIIALKDNADNYRKQIEDKEKQLKELDAEATEERETLTKEIDKLKAELTRKSKQNISRGSKRTGELIGVFEATGYCSCSICNGKWTGQPTASGTDYVAGRTIAVDPKVIPLGSRVEVEGLGTFTAEDTGSAIKGNIIDIYFNSHQEALNWGRRQVKVYRR